MLKVIRGNPTAEELAAALAVVQSRAAGRATANGPAGPLRAWADPARIALRTIPRASPGAWRGTYWPH
jgi:hypothetical protein